MTENITIIKTNCDRCGKELNGEPVEVKYNTGEIQFWCEECFDKHAFTCEHCGDVHPFEEVVTVTFRNGNTEDWCEECADDDAFICGYCGEYHPNDEATEVRCGRYTQDWCEECVNDHAFRCEHCGEWHHEDDACTVNVRDGRYGGTVEETWCESCRDEDALQCEDCEEWYENNLIDTYDLWDGGTIDLCESCRYDNWYTCESCGNIVNQYDVHCDDYGDDYCPDCWRERSFGENVQCYHHTGGAYFFLHDGEKVEYWRLDNEDAKRLFLGIELECEHNDSRARLADDIMEWFTNDEFECKTDSSLGSEGLEIVSQPMEPMYHLSGDVWEKVVGFIREHGGRSHDGGNCGLHIHLSRNYFKDHDAVYRLDRLFHHFKDEMLNFSRRDYWSAQHWCRIDDDEDILCHEDIEERKQAWASKKRYAGRYEAVNDCNANTVEIRLWRGTLNIDTLRATIELTTALAIVANSMSDKLADSLSWPQLKLLMRFALEQGGIPHNELDAYLKARNL